MSRRPRAVPDIDPLRAATSRPTTGCVIDAANVRGEGLEERSKVTTDVLIGDQPVVIDHRAGDGQLCAGPFDDLGVGIAKDFPQRLVTLTAPWAETLTQATGFS